MTGENFKISTKKNLKQIKINKNIYLNNKINNSNDKWKLLKKNSKKILK